MRPHRPLGLRSRTQRGSWKDQKDHNVGASTAQSAESRGPHALERGLRPCWCCHPDREHGLRPILTSEG